MLMTIPLACVLACAVLLYRQVYEVHPAHAFLVVPDKTSSSQSSGSGPTIMDLARQSTGSMEEPCE